MKIKENLKSLLIPVSGLLFVFFILLGMIYFFVPDNIDNFLSIQNLKTVFKQTVIVGIGAMAMTMIIVSGGIDLSAGSVVALTAVFCAHCVNWLNGEIVILGIFPVPFFFAFLSVLSLDLSTVPFRHD